MLSGVRKVFVVCQLNLEDTLLDFFWCRSSSEIVVSDLKDDVSDLIRVADLRNFVHGLFCCVTVVFYTMDLGFESFRIQILAI